MAREPINEFRIYRVERVAIYGAVDLGGTWALVDTKQKRQALEAGIVGLKPESIWADRVESVEITPDEYEWADNTASAPGDTVDNRIALFVIELQDMIAAGETIEDDDRFAGKVDKLDDLDLWDGE